MRCVSINAALNNIPRVYPRYRSIIMSEPNLWGPGTSGEIGDTITF